MIAMAVWIGTAMFSATAADVGVVRYKTLFEGSVIEEEGTIVVECRGDTARVHTVPHGAEIEGAPSEVGYIDYATLTTYQAASGERLAPCHTRSGQSDLAPLEYTGEHATILGYDCLRATTVVRSNHIDLWFTRDAGIRGTPLTSLVVPDALVLKIVRNGNFVREAEAIDLGESTVPDRPLLPDFLGERVDAAEYRSRVTESWVTTVQIFDHERLYWGKVENPPGGDELVRHYAGGTVIARRVDLPRVPDDTMVYAELTQYSNGDAYDRTGSLFLIPVDRDTTFLQALRDSIGLLPALRGRDGASYQGVVATPGYEPPLEVLRFITPFGIRHYNDQVKVSGITWEDSVVYKADVTDLLPALRGSAWIGAFIGNYDAGGHVVSLRLRYYPGEKSAKAEPPARRCVRSLFNTVNVMEMAGQQYGRVFGSDTLRVSFGLDEPVRDAFLRYVTTGHGGWGNGDEFQPRVNEVSLDGVVAARFAPWRSDCATYRRWNPSSGNFWNGVSSSDLSRSGWCPGALVSAVTIPLGDLGAGTHVISVAIPMGKPEGGSASAWNVSGVLIGEYE